MPSGCCPHPGPWPRLADLVAYVFQDSVLFTDTIENNIRMGNTAATMAEVEQAAKNAGIHEVIQALPKGYQTVVGRVPPAPSPCWRSPWTRPSASAS